MNKLITSLIGVGLILLGLVALAGSVIAPVIFPNMSFWGPWRLWPVIILGLGLFLGALALGSLRHRGLGALFIPALPILTTGGILFFASVFNLWGIWSLLWPLEVLSLAVGFALAAVFARNVWLGIPAIIIGLNGLVLAFCNTTGLWEAWSVLWTIEPLSVGLILLLVAARTRSMAVGIVGLCFCGFASIAFIGMSSLLAFGGLLFRVAGPAALILCGGGLLAWGLLRKPAASDQSPVVSNQ